MHLAICWKFRFLPFTPNINRNYKYKTKLFMFEWREKGKAVFEKNPQKGM